MLTGAKPEGLTGAEWAVHSNELRPGGLRLTPVAAYLSCRAQPGPSLAPFLLQGAGPAGDRCIAPGSQSPRLAQARALTGPRRARFSLHAAGPAPDLPHHQALTPLQPWPTTPLSSYRDGERSKSE
jgi:hypothetical protein